MCVCPRFVRNVERPGVEPATCQSQAHHPNHDTASKMVVLKIIWYLLDIAK